MLSSGGGLVGVLVGSWSSGGGGFFDAALSGATSILSSVRGMPVILIFVFLFASVWFHEMFKDWPVTHSRVWDEQSHLTQNLHLPKPHFVQPSWGVMRVLEGYYGVNDVWADSRRIERM